ncbi:phage portal protein [Salinicola sp. CPA57]|uniref:phage portal protein n=1 Tax=Salinicola sp. CPA57 TaxID=1949080 RepID=UPI000DA20E17|nr:phage portal protein [Salinicola sp. CPA57]
MGIFDRFKKKSLAIDYRNTTDRVREPFTGAWQRNISAVRDDVIYTNTVFSCVSLISQDIAKCDMELIKKDNFGVSTVVRSPQFSKILRNPNSYQTMQEFIEAYVLSLLRFGNTYILKESSSFGLITALHIIDPRFVKTRIATTQDVFYQIQKRDDDVAISEQSVVIPARDMIHDRINAFNHPLAGISPLVAAYSSAEHQANMQSDASTFFKNGSRPSGILYHESEVEDEVAEAFAKNWRENFSSIANSGSVPFLHSGVQYKALEYTNASDSMLVEQLGLTITQICTAFRVPEFLINTGQKDSVTSGEQRSQAYYSQCLQPYIKRIETKLTDGLGLYDVGLELQINIDDLIRLDQSKKVENLTSAVKGAIMTLNEARLRLNMSPVEGGDTIYLQQQYWSLEQLNKREQAPSGLNPADDINNATVSNAKKETGSINQDGDTE